MASITLGDAKHEIPPFKLREIQAAAPYIDRVLSQRRALSLRAGETPEQATERMVEENDHVLEGMISGLSETIAVVAIGIIKGRKEYPYNKNKIDAVVEEINSELGMDEIQLLSPLFDDILREAGMVKNRPTVAPGTETTSPSASASTESSQSLSQPVAPAETGTE